MPDLQGLGLGFTASIYKPVLLKNVATIVVDRNYFYRSTQPTYYQMSTRTNSSCAGPKSCQHIPPIRCIEVTPRIPEKTRASRPAAAT